MLFQACPPMTIEVEDLHIGELYYDNSYGKEGLGMLKEGLRHHPGLVRDIRFQSENVGKKEEMRAFWDALAPQGHFVITITPKVFLGGWPIPMHVDRWFHKEIGEAEWNRIWTVLDFEDSNYKSKMCQLGQNPSSH